MKPHEESGIHLCRQGWKTASRTEATKHDAGVGAVQVVLVKRLQVALGAPCSARLDDGAPRKKVGCWCRHVAGKQTAAPIPQALRAKWQCSGFLVKRLLVAQGAPCSARQS